MCQEKRGVKKESKRKEHGRLSRLSHELCKLASLMLPSATGYGVSGPQGRRVQGAPLHCRSSQSIGNSGEDLLLVMLPGLEEAGCLGYQKTETRDGRCRCAHMRG
jgi:hypothetical protein